MATAFAVYSATDNSLCFYKRDTVPSAGSTFEGKVATAVYEGIETTEYGYGEVPWYVDGNYAKITTISFIDPISPISTAYWFYYCTLATSCNIDKLDTSKVTSMYCMFVNCKSLTSLDLSSFDTSNVTDMASMFMQCNALTTLDLSSFNTSSVTKMTKMFDDCYALTTLDLSSFNTSSVTDMYSMFGSCSALTTLDLSSFNTSKVTGMDYMFDSCIALASLDLSSFNTSNTDDMSRMFQYCKALTSLDLSSFDTSKVTNMISMFSGCSALTTIYVSDTWIASNLNTTNMFANCTSLVGDIAFNSSYVDKTYAKYTGGYLTYMPYIAPVKGELVIKGNTLSKLGKAVRILTNGVTTLTPEQMIQVINDYAKSWAGSLTFSGTYATATYYTAAGCSLVVDKSSGMAFLTIQGGTSTSYENIYYDSSTTYMKLPTGVAFLPTQTYGGGTSGSTKRYYTAVFTGITGKINVAVDLGNYNGSYDYVRPTITMTYA